MSFCRELDNVELSSYDKILMTESRDRGHNQNFNSKMLTKWGFRPFETAKIFFQKSLSLTCVPLWCLNGRGIYGGLYTPIYEIFTFLTSFSKIKKKFPSVIKIILGIYGLKVFIF